MAVASARPYASLHLAADKQPCQYPTRQFLQAGCPSCHPTKSIKALKANIKQYWIILNSNVLHYLVRYFLKNVAGQYDSV